jgi:two-component sensor histidine kinase
MKKKELFPGLSVFSVLVVIIGVFSFVSLLDRYNRQEISFFLAAAYAFLITGSLFFAHYRIIPKLSFLSSASQVVFKAFVYGGAFILGYMPVWIGEAVWRSSQHSTKDVFRFSIDIFNNLIQVPLRKAPLTSAVPQEVANAFTSLLGILFVAVLLSSIAAYADTKWRKEKRRAADRENQINILRARMQPHFLFNTLNTIATMITSQPRRAENMLHTLADFYRDTMEFTERKTVKLGEEITFVEKYAALLNARFDNKIKLVTVLSPGCEEREIPSMIIQPLVENSIVHGWPDRKKELEIELSALELGNELIIEVKDTGGGFAVEKLARNPEKENHALDIIRNRISLAYGNRAVLSIDSVPGEGTSVRIKLPEDSK